MTNGGKPRNFDIILGKNHVYFQTKRKQKEIMATNKSDFNEDAPQS